MKSFSVLAFLLVVFHSGCEPVPKAPAKPEEVKQLAAGFNRFALDLYREPVSSSPSDPFIPIRFIVIHLTAAVNSDDRNY